MKPPSSKHSPGEQEARIRAIIGDGPVPGPPRRIATARAEPSPEPGLEDDLVDVLVTSKDIGDALEMNNNGRTGSVARLVEFTRVHLGVVITLCVALLCFAAYRVMGAAGHQVPEAVASVVTSTASPVATPSSVVESITVHVIGAVASPGVVSLPKGSRVADAIAAAGGLGSQADPGELNLAAQVPDGAQLIIGTHDSPRGELRTGAPAGPVGESAQSAGGGKLNLNMATAANLEALPGVGPVMAKKIIDWREAHGRFTSVAQLQEIDGVGAKTYAKLADLVEV